MDKPNLHKNHRQRMRKRFSENRFDGFIDHEILEMVLFSILPRRNTNEIAHDLLNRFGDIPSVLSAESDELLKVNGIGEMAVHRMKFLLELYCQVSIRVLKDTVIVSGDSAGMYAMLRMSLSPKGSAAIVYLDKDGRIIRDDDLYRGKSKMTESLCDVAIETARSLGAKRILLMHNHKNNPGEPSADDLLITEELRKKATCAGISSVMHVIVNNDGYVHI